MRFLFIPHFGRTPRSALPGDRRRPRTAAPGAHRGPVACAAVLIGALGLSGCGGDAAPAPAKQAQPGAATPSAMESMPGHDMGDPHATPAYELKGVQLKKGEFALLETRLPGSDSAKGTAWLAQGDNGTTVTVMLTGLRPGDGFVAHLHAEKCTDEGAGPHFKFDPDGPEMPPNEVHLAFTADASGKAMMTVNNERKTGDRAKSIVVHPKEKTDNPLACADFTE